VEWGKAATSSAIRVAVGGLLPGRNLVRKGLYRFPFCTEGVIKSHEPERGDRHRIRPGGDVCGWVLVRTTPGGLDGIQFWREGVGG
jgi:hypothetical protein